MEYRVRSTKTGRSSKRRRAADASVVTILCLLLVLLLFKVILVPVRITSPQVSDLKEGELVLVDRISKYAVDYAVGDIVRAEAGSGLAEYRLAAKGGSTYSVRGGKTYLDGALTDESAYSEGWPRGTEFELKVPEDCVLLLPDVRSAATDPNDYLIEYNAIDGEVRFRISPLKRLAIFA